MRAPCGPAPGTVVDALMAAKTPGDFAPALGAAVAIALAAERGIRAQVMMPYADRLGRFSAWFAQLWAESLGKNGKGTAPDRLPRAASTSTASCSFSWTARAST